MRASTDRWPESLVEGAAVETRDGMVFTVKGSVHPPDRVVAYLRYVPDPNGERARGGRRYRRVYSVADQEAALRARGVRSGREDPELGVPMHTVPRSEVVRVYDPRECLRRLSVEGPEDSLSAEALALADLLRESAGASLEALGLTGSLMLGLHTAASDIDLVVYGVDPCRAVHAALLRLLDDPSSALARPREQELSAIHAVHRQDTPLSSADFARLQAHKVNEGRFGDVPYFVRFVKLAQEIPERYGDPRFVALGMTTVEARVTDDGDALFTPCRYVLGDVRTLDGVRADDLHEVISYRGRFAEQARVGQRVRAYGALERAIWRDGHEALRLMVGSRPGDYLLGLEEDSAAGHSQARQVTS